MPKLRPLVAGNWKMNGLTASLSEVASIRDAVASGGAGAAETVLCLPYTLLAPAAEVIGRADGLALGAQDCHTAANGAFTGDISAEMVQDLGAGFVIVGHSERRGGHGETDELVRGKAEAGMRAGLVVILCVGETRAEREGGGTLRVLGRQIDECLPPKSSGKTLVVAYEPVWAIGTGLVPSRDETGEVHAFIRRRISTILKQEGDNVRILYGGSVKPSNASEIADIANVDGVLVGGASLEASEFMGIVRAFR